MIEWIAAALLAVVGVLHSVLGEREILQPLFAQDTWKVAGISRWAFERILRFAWHLTTIAWWALAAALVGAPISVAFAATCLLSAAIILIMLPGHLAWPMFLAAGLLALWSADAVPEWLLWAAASVAAAVALVAAGFHVAWAFGVRAGVANAIPQRPETNEPTFRPDRSGTLAVAAALAAFAALVIATASGRAGQWAAWLTLAGAIVLTLRVVGDGRWVGVTKRVRDTGFAEADDRMWTPAAALLALGGVAAFALA